MDPVWDTEPLEPIQPRGLCHMQDGARKKISKLKRKFKKPFQNYIV